LTPAEIIEAYNKNAAAFAFELEQNIEQVPLQWKMDFRKSVIFISGNLDGAYQGAGLMDEDFASADDLHELSKKVNLVTILDNLKMLFRKEEIARLGTDHVIYPAWSSKSYRALIESHLNRFKRDFENNIGVKIEFDKSVNEFIFNEGVIPAQGSRPLLSMINQLIYANGSTWQLAALKNEKVPSVLKVRVADATEELQIDGFSGKRKVLTFATNISNVKKKTDQELHPEPIRTRAARHEAAHAVVGMALYGELPLKVKSRSNVAATGGLVRFGGMADRPYSRMLDELSVQLAGKVGEEIYFGRDGVSAGADNDLQQATKLASDIVSRFGLGSHLGQSFPAMNAPHNLTSFKARDDIEIEKLLQEQFERSKSILTEQKALWDALSEYMREHTSVPRQELLKMVQDNFKGSKLDTAKSPRENGATNLEECKITLDEIK
jgi:cell division protease FtsH